MNGKRYSSEKGSLDLAMESAASIRSFPTLGSVLCWKGRSAVVNESEVSNVSPLPL